MTRKSRQRVIAIVSAGVVEFFACVLHADVPIRHELAPAWSWSSYRYAHDDYVINETEAPSISAHDEYTRHRFSLAYSFFFTPISDTPDTPIRLEPFYARPASLRLELSVQPEYTASHVFQNTANAYRALSSSSPQQRRVALRLELQPWTSTGLTFMLDSAEREEDVTLANTFGLLGDGKSDEIRRQYGFGLSRYLSDHFRVSADIAALDREYAAVKTHWTAETPLSRTQVHDSTEADGRELRLLGIYIFHKRIRTRLGYRYRQTDGHSTTMTSHDDRAPLGASFYDDTLCEQMFTVSTTWFLKYTTSLQLGGSFARHTLERNYRPDQIMTYAWDAWSLSGRISHDIRRRFGLWLAYEFSRQDGEVENRHPQTEGNPRTIFHTYSNMHTVQTGVNIRL